MPSFGRKFENEVVQHGEAVRARLATRGAVYGIRRVVEKTGSSVELQIEVEEDLKEEPVGKLVNEVEERLAHPEDKFREDLAALSLNVGVNIEIEGLVKAPQYNGKRGTVRGLDAAAARLEIELEDGRMLRVSPHNARAEGVEGKGGTSARLQGACRVCAGCKKTEGAPGIFKSCSGCRAVYYCGRPCQTRDWKEGGHKKVCGKSAEALGQGGMRRLVVLPAERDAYPYMQTAQGTLFAEHMQHIASILGCSHPSDLRNCQIARGEASDLLGVLLLYNASSTARGNSRASGLTVPLDSRGDLSSVCGNAVLLRMAVEQDAGGGYVEASPQSLADLDLETYQLSLGIFSMVQIPSAGVLTSFFGKTPQGEAAAEEMACMLAQRGGGTPTDDEMWNRIEERTASKTAAANRKKGKKKP